MTETREQKVRGVRRRREILCLVLECFLVLFLASILILAAPDPVTPSAGSTWSTTVQRLYFRISRDLGAYIGEQLPSGWSAVKRIVVLPVAGDAVARYDVASPCPKGLVDFLQQTPELKLPPAWDVDRHIVSAARLKPGDVGLRIIFNKLALAEERFEATFHVEAVLPGQPPVELVPDIEFRGTSVTLPWFIKQKTRTFIRVVLALASMALMLGGGLLTVIYYHLVAGHYVGPVSWKRPLNELRAATGLIASSLALLSGFILLVMVFLLSPSTGDALGTRRTHVDIMVDGDELVFPSPGMHQTTNALRDVATEIACQSVAELVGVRDEESTETSHAGVDKFMPWLRYRLPVLLRTPETTIRISKGASWRIFAASEGEAVTTSPDVQWPGLDAAERRKSVNEVFDAMARKMPERGIGIPLPWDTNFVAELDSESRASLKEFADEEGGAGRFARLVISSFQSPSRSYLDRWLAGCKTRPPGERVYAVMLPGQPRSAARVWEALEGRLLCARALSDRVASTETWPADLAFDDKRLEMFGAAPPIKGTADITSPVFKPEGAGLVWIRNFGSTRDLSAEVAARYSGESVNLGNIQRIARDFRDWFLSGRSNLERTLVFAIPRFAFYGLIVGLGIIFAIAGTRCEQNAQGVQRWLPPLTALLSAVAVPVLAGGWIFSRNDTTRYVVFGYADLAYWGALFLWLCLAVLPLFDGRVRVGLLRDAWMTTVLVAAMVFMAVLPFFRGAFRLAASQFSLVSVLALAGGALLVSLVRRKGGASLRITLLIFIAAAAGYWLFWGWKGQDLAAMNLLGLFAIMIASGWSRDLDWWQITGKADYDRIPWLQPVNRLMLALVLTLAGAAVLYCSFPAIQSTGPIQGYISYSIVICVLPFLVCAGILIAVDLLEREIV